MKSEGREIKFRAWDKSDKRMIVHEQDFIPVKVTSMGVLRLNPHHEEMFWEFMPDDRFELMQFTGLHDKNGKEIYEEDILDGNFVVTFYNGSFGFWAKENSIPEFFMLYRYLSIKEVIGNIYET